MCVGDSGHDQTGHFVSIEGDPLIVDEATATGIYLERSATVAAEDGRLTVKIGKAGSGKNTCLCWLTMRRVVP